MTNNITDKEFILVNQEAYHDNKSMGFFWVFGDGNKPNSIPDNWMYPIDYSKGKIHIRIEVLEKADNTTVNYLCRILVKFHSRDTLGIIGYKSVMINGIGEYYYEESIENIYLLKKPSCFNLSYPIYEIQLVVADVNGQAVHTVWETDLGKYIGYPETARYFPMKVRYTAVVVPADYNFSGWNNISLGVV